MKHLPLLMLLLLAGGCTMLQLDGPPEENAAVRLEQGLAALDAGLYAEAFDDLAWVYATCAGYAASHQALAGLAALELDPRNRAGREAVGSELLGRLIQHPGPPAWVRPLTESAYLMSLALGAPAPGAARADQPAQPDSTPGQSTPAASALADDTPVVDEPAGVRVDSARSVARGDNGSAAAARLPGAPERPAAPGVPAAQAAGSREAVVGCGRRIETEEWMPPALPTLPGPSMVAILAEAEAGRAEQAARADSLTRALGAAQQELQETRAELERIRKTLKP